MSRKKPFTLRSLDREEAAQANANFDAIFRNKLESTIFHDPVTSATIVKPIQVQELGKTFFSATGSATVVKTIKINSIIGSVLFAEAHAQAVLVQANVTDVTATSITIEASVLSSAGTATAFSSITTASVGVYWKVIGS